MPPKATLEEVKGFALTTGKLMFSGESTEVWAQVKSNIRDISSPLNRKGSVAMDLRELTPPMGDKENSPPSTSTS